MDKKEITKLLSELRTALAKLNSSRDFNPYYLTSQIVLIEQELSKVLRLDRYMDLYIFDRTRALKLRIAMLRINKPLDNTALIRLRFQGQYIVGLINRRIDDVN